MNRLSRSTASTASRSGRPSSSIRMRASRSKRGNHEVPRPAAGVQDAQLGGAIGPAGEAAGGGRAVLQPAQVVHLALAEWQRPARVARGPPGAQGVVQQELHHVVLGE